MTRKLDNLSWIIIIAVIAFDVFLWHQMVFMGSASDPELHFLDVGQGDSELLILPGNVKILTDAGPDKKVSGSLGKILSPADRYIDLAIISHPQLDHFNGFNDLIKRYDFGAFILNGRSVELPEWKTLIKEINNKKIPLITLGAGDVIKYAENRIDIISPNREWLQSGELNDTGLVELVRTPKWTGFLGADIGFNLEEYLTANYPGLRAHIMKVSHHGSKYSSGEEFLKTLNPKLAVIEVGARNNYGHPTGEALNRIGLADIHNIFRTDQDDTVSIRTEGGKLKVYTEN